MTFGGIVKSIGMWLYPAGEIANPLKLLAGKALTGQLRGARRARAPSPARTAPPASGLSQVRERRKNEAAPGLAESNNFRKISTQRRQKGDRKHAIRGAKRQEIALKWPYRARGIFVSNAELRSKSVVNQQIEGWVRSAKKYFARVRWEVHDANRPMDYPRGRERKLRLN
jgi:hypothetical protein